MKTPGAFPVSSLPAFREFNKVCIYKSSLINCSVCLAVIVFASLLETSTLKPKDSIQ
jgi:hypothetical protein